MVPPISLAARVEQIAPGAGSLESVTPFDITGMKSRAIVHVLIAAPAAPPTIADCQESEAVSGQVVKKAAKVRSPLRA